MIVGIGGRIDRRERWIRRGASGLMDVPDVGRLRAIVVVVARGRHRAKGWLRTWIAVATAVRALIKGGGGEVGGCVSMASVCVEEERVVIASHGKRMSTGTGYLEESCLEAAYVGKWVSA